MKSVVAVCLLAVLGCGGSKITGVRVVAKFPTEAPVHQLDFALEVGTTAPTFANAQTRPMQAGAALGSPQSLVFYVDDSPTDYTCGVRAPEANLSGWQAVRLQAHEVVDCVVDLTAGNAGSPDAGTSEGDAAVSDGSEGEDGSELGPDSAADAGVTVDGPPPGVDVPPAPDGPPRTPDGPIVAADAPIVPIDAPALPPDAPVTHDLPALALDVGPDVAPPSNGCASGARKAFADSAPFPNIAGCGAGTVSYAEAVTTAAAVCAPGWHWCGVDDIKAQPNTQPAQVSGTCGWLDTRQAVCGGTSHSAYSKPGCQGLSLESSTGGASTGAPCTVDVGCTSPWKFAVELTKWDSSSLSDPGGCIDHVGFECATGGSCWILCCK